MNPSDQQVRYCAEPKAALGAGKVLLRNPLNARMVIVERETAAALSACGSFASVEEQCFRFASARGPEKGDCCQSLKSLIDAGLFVSSSELRDLLCRLVSPPTSRKIDCIAIPTRNRPDALRRLLNELHQNLVEFGRNPRILVLDDSELESLQVANAEVIAAHHRRSEAQILHIDHRTREHFVNELAHDTGICPEGIAFALQRSPNYPVSTGAARNTLLLASAGQCVLFLDDDIRCRFASIPNSSEEIVLGESNVESWFFEARSEIEQCRFVQEDLLGLHERMLNFGPDDPVIDETAMLGANLCAIFRRLESGKARVVVSSLGILGDGGMDSPLAAYISGAETWARLTSSEELYRAAIRNRLILRGARSYAIMCPRPTQTHCLAVDNTQTLPPFLPVMRGQDGLFGLLLSQSVPNSLFGFIPRAILHSPERVREFKPDAAASSCRFMLSEMVMALISARGTISGDTTEKRLVSLGKSLLELRCARNEEFRERLRSAVEPVLMGILQVTQSRLDRSGTDAYWRKDVQQIRDAALAGMNSRNHPIPADLEGEPQAVRKLREAVTAFAELLKSWPTLVESSRRIGL